MIGLGHHGKKQSTSKLNPPLFFSLATPLGTEKVEREERQKGYDRAERKAGAGQHKGPSATCSSGRVAVPRIMRCRP
jgi:hypothetical protein